LFILIPSLSNVLCLNPLYRSRAAFAVKSGLVALNGLKSGSTDVYRTYWMPSAIKMAKKRQHQLGPSLKPGWPIIDKSLR